MGSSLYDDVDHLLHLVRKPSRYLGNELNAVHKDLDEVDLRFALAFPDTYEIGMSHLGFRIIYHLLNRRDDVAAERFFCPWTDMHSLLRRRGIPLFSQESRTPLSQFDVIGFSLAYEMAYTNVLDMLELGGIPLGAKSRPEAFPLVIGGGPCTLNPEPIAAFFDAFVIGDGEHVIDEIVDAAIEAKAEGWGKDRLLITLAHLEGVYVPSLFQVTYDSHGRVVSICGLEEGCGRVSRRIEASLDSLSYPTDAIVPYTRVVHDRMSLEIARGCTKGCRFCQAGFAYRPVRERSIERNLELAETSLRASGYEELSLLSLSAGDYSSLPELMRELAVRYVPEQVALSFPSLRIGSVSDEIMEMVKEVRKTGITVAPEAGTERLRNLINKDVQEEEVLETVRSVYRQGWRSLKLYFMIGLPTETHEDLEGIVKLCDRIVKEMGHRRNRKKLSVSLSTFVPKPHTPFQWAEQLPVPVMGERLGFLRKNLRRRGIQVKWQDPRLSLLEGAFSRGDRSLSAVLSRAHALGCRFDGWSDQLRFDLWQKAFAECEMDVEAYATRRWALEEVLPWSHIDIGVSPQYLREDYERALAGQRSPDCRDGECHGCGVCDFEDISCVLAKQPLERSPFPGMRAFQGVYHRGIGREVHKKFRVQYTKTDSARFLSHLELNNVIVRALRRANIPMRFSQGYHPMPRIDFGPALPVGVESRAEFFDLETFGHIDADEVLEGIAASFPAGMTPIDCREIQVDSPSLFRLSTVTHFQIGVPDEEVLTHDSLNARIDHFCRMTNYPVKRTRDGETREWDAKEVVEALEVVSPGVVKMGVRTGSEVALRLMELIGAILVLEEEEVRGLRIMKTGVRFSDASA